MIPPPLDTTISGYMLIIAASTDLADEKHKTKHRSGSGASETATARRKEKKSMTYSQEELLREVPVEAIRSVLTWLVHVSQEDGFDVAAFHHARVSPSTEWNRLCSPSLVSNGSPILN